MVSIGEGLDEQTSDLVWDPFDIDIDAHPYEVWRRMRDEAPVYRNDRFGFYALSRFDDVDAAHRDPATFSSAHGTVLELMTDEPYPDAPLIFLDPPEHTRLRALVSRAFTPRRVNELEDRIRELCTDFLDRQMGSGGFDYLQDFAVRLPSLVISSFFGVPIGEQDDVRYLIDTMFTIEPGVGTMNPTALQATADLHIYFSSLLELRLSEPTDDMLTALNVAGIELEDGSLRRLTIPEAALFAVMLVSAGTETVARLLGWAAVILAAHPEQRAELARDFSLIPNAIEELLRYEAPSPVQARFATRAVELHGTVLPEGSKVLLLTGFCRSRRARSSRTRTGSTSDESSAPTCRSGTESTSASELRWLGSNRASRSRRRCGDSRPGKWITSTACGSTRARCAATRTCRSEI